MPACVAPSSSRELQTCGGVSEALAGVRRRDRQRLGVLGEQAESAAHHGTNHKLLAAVNGNILSGLQPAVSRDLAHQGGDALLSYIAFLSSVSAWRPVTPSAYLYDIGVHVDSHNLQFRAHHGDLGLHENFEMESAWSWVALRRVCLWGESLAALFGIPASGWGTVACGCFVGGDMGGPVNHRPAHQGGDALLSYIAFLSSVSAWRPVTPSAYLYDIGVHVDSHNLQFRAHYGDLGLHENFEMESAWSWVALRRVCLWVESLVALFGIPASMWGTVACGCFVGGDVGGGVWRASFACYIQE
ncbi:hypothetical protein JKP88DRAFT_54894 [Tribonema minus]|uniref:Uncharacterized protein n=1 Tax=Tribonema minus TaxID=303371 RepID=A0A836CGR6_9STRA|nr:hypothetical protein JKP88DRAFT_54894 [Tribonema minus]